MCDVYVFVCVCLVTRQRKCPPAGKKASHPLLSPLGLFGGEEPLVSRWPNLCEEERTKGEECVKGVVLHFASRLLGENRTF